MQIQLSQKRFQFLEFDATGQDSLQTFYHYTQIPDYDLLTVKDSSVKRFNKIGFSNLVYDETVYKKGGNIQGDGTKDRLHLYSEILI